FDLGLLEPAGDLSVDGLLDALEEAEAARVIAEERTTPGRYRFTHALIRQTLYDELSSARRIRLHARVGEALVTRWGAEPGAHIAEIAHHFLQAAPGGEAARAITYARLAGERALAMLAYEEGVRFYAMALRVLELMAPVKASVRASGGAGDAQAHEQQRCTLLLALGDAQFRAGDTADAKASFEQAAAIARLLVGQGAGTEAPVLLARAAVGAFLVAEMGVTDMALVRLL